MDRRGNETGILNPTQKTLDHHHLHQHHHQFNKDPNPDPDPAQPANAPLVGTASNSRPLPPPPPLLPPQADPHPTTSAANSAAVVRYRECLKNHAASMGAHVVDGCGEFMPSGEEGTPEALKCAACECHRNFHKREIDGESQAAVNSYYTNNLNRNNNQRTAIYPAPAPLPPPQQQQYRYSHGPSTGPTPNPPIMMAFGRSGGAPAESSSEDLNMFHSNAGAHPGVQPSFSASKKRFRTKFSKEQKDRMQEFAEKLGWRMQKQDEEEVQQFCNELGVKRQVFKVWMHNNKQAMKKKQP